MIQSLVESGTVAEPLAPVLSCVESMRTPRKHD